MAQPRALATLMLAIVSGCSEPDQESFMAVASGMHAADVHALLGSPDSVSQGAVGAYVGTTEQWHTDEATFSVQYLNGEVKLKTITPRDAAP